MKVSIEKKELFKTLSHMYAITERKSTIPILLNVKIEAEDNLKFTATNIDMEIVEIAEASISTKGAITVPAQTFFDIVRKLPEGEVVLETKNSKVDIYAGKAKFSIPSLPVEDFPVMATGDIPFKFSVSPDDLIKLIDKTKFAVSTEETRYFLNGIYLHTTEAKGKEVLRAVATDGHRLALLDVASPEGAKGMPGVIIPRKLIMELRKLLDEVSSEIKIESSESKIRFSFGNIVITSKVIEGKFPNYEKVIPTGNDKVLELDHNLFATAVDRVSSVSNEKSKAVKLHISREGLTISANSPEAGTGTEELDATYNSDDSIDIGFNSKYLLDIASQIEGKNVKFTMADGSSPAVVSEIDDESSVYVLMPMRI